MEKLHVSAYSVHLQVLTIFLLKEFYIICLNRVVMLRPRGLGILYITLIAKSCQNLKMAAIGRNM